MRVGSYAGQFYRIVETRVPVLLLLSTETVVVYGRLIDKTGVVAEDVNPAELVESLLEGRSLLLVATHIAVDVVKPFAEFLLEDLAKSVLDVEADHLSSSGNEIFGQGFANSGLSSQYLEP